MWVKPLLVGLLVTPVISQGFGKDWFHFMAKAWILIVKGRNSKARRASQPRLRAKLGKVGHEK